MSERIPLFEVSKPQVLINLLGCVSVLSEEPRLRFDGHNISVLEMDPSHVAMVDFKLPDTLFDSFNNEYHGVISVNLTDMLKTLGKVGKDDTLSATLIKTSGSLDKIEWRMRSYGLTRYKTITTLEPNDDEVPMPKIFFKSKTRLLMRQFKIAIDDLSKTNEHIKFTSADSGLELNATGDYETSKTPFLKGDDSVIEHRVDEGIQEATFTSEYLTNILKVADKVSEVITIDLLSDMPLKFDVELSLGTLIYFVAPCVGM